MKPTLLAVCFAAALAACTEGSVVIATAPEGYRIVSLNYAFCDTASPDYFPPPVLSEERQQVCTTDPTCKDQPACAVPDVDGTWCPRDCQGRVLGCKVFEPNFRCFETLCRQAGYSLLGDAGAIEPNETRRYPFPTECFSFVSVLTPVGGEPGRPSYVRHDFSVEGPLHVP